MVFAGDRRHAEPGGPLRVVPEYQKEMARLGLDRAVFVQAAANDEGSSATLNAVAAFGVASRAVLLVADPGAPPGFYDMLRAQGVAGLRCAADSYDVQTWERIERIAAVAADRGFHCEVLIPAAALPDWQAMLMDLPGRVVIEAGGTLRDESRGRETSALLRLLDIGRFWAKLRAPDLVRGDLAAAWGRVAHLRRIVSHAPERCLWGSYWPQGAIECATLLDAFADWAPDPATQRRILVDNPTALYGFAS
jgi:D-galactarolactone isomerase